MALIYPVATGASCSTCLGYLHFVQLLSIYFFKSADSIYVGLANLQIWQRHCAAGACFPPIIGLLTIALYPGRNTVTLVVASLLEEFKSPIHLPTPGIKTFFFCFASRVRTTLVSMTSSALTLFWILYGPTGSVGLVIAGLMAELTPTLGF